MAGHKETANYAYEGNELSATYKVSIVRASKDIRHLSFLT